MQITQFPISLKNFNQDLWNKKVASTLMMSFQAEQQSLPYLVEFDNLLDRIYQLPIEQSLQDKEVLEYFLNNAIPTICSKLITSKYFRNPQVLILANKILQKSIRIFFKDLTLTRTYNKLTDLIAIVLDSDFQYYKTNNQIQYKSYPWLYFNHVQSNTFLNTLNVGNFIDAIKYQTSIKKASWSRAVIKQITEDIITVTFLQDLKNEEKDFVNDSIQIAPFKTKSLDYQWRQGLKQNDQIDCCDKYGSWYSSTILQTQMNNFGMKKLKVTFKIYDATGDKQNQKGKYYGLSDTYDEQDIQIHSPRIQKVGTIAKLKQCSMSRNHIDFVNDSNDPLFYEIDKQKMLFIPRSKYCSSFLFQLVNKVIKQEGFNKIFKYLEENINQDLLVSFVTAIGGISPNLHRFYARQIIPRLKTIIAKHLFDQSSIQSISKEKTETIFSNFKKLVKRVQTTESYKEYEMNCKLELTNNCLKSQSLKKRLQGLSQIKDILRNIKMYLSSKTAYFSNWLQNNRIFQKIYIQNNHVQLIKKSSDLFKFLLSENALQIHQLRLLYTTAQKGDHQTRISVYKMFQDASHSFKKNHVDFLIDQILESEASVVSCQDIDLLYELSRVSNNFPHKKVLSFFLKLILSEDTGKILLEKATKKYSQMVTSNYDLMSMRKQIVKMLIEKLESNSREIVLTILQNIFENIGIAEVGKYELLEYLNEISIMTIVLNIIKDIKYQMEQSNFLRVLGKLFKFLETILSNSKKIQIDVPVFIQYWQQLVQKNKYIEETQLYYKWCNSMIKTEHAFNSSQSDQLEQFFNVLTSAQKISEVTKLEFEIIISLFLDINYRLNNLSFSSIWRNGKDEKIVKLFKNFKDLKYYPEMMKIIYEIKDFNTFETGLQFYNDLYTAQILDSDIRNQYLQLQIAKFFDFFQSKQYFKLFTVLKIIQLIINESEQDRILSLKSLSTLRPGQQIKLRVINQAAFEIQGRKNFEIATTANTRLLQIRKKLANHTNLNWKEVKITQKQELTDLMNNKLLGELNIKFDQPIKISRRYFQQRHQDILINNKLSSKAIKAFQFVFKKFSNNGFMSKQDCSRFILVCLGDSFRSYEDQIQSVFQKYDTDKDSLLTLENFLDFYEDSSRQRIQTVWSNLRNCGIRYDLKPVQQSQNEEMSFEQFPRYKLSQNHLFYEILFKLLDEEEKIAKIAWDMLYKLPVSTQIYKQIFALEINENNYIKCIDLVRSPYKLIYYLYILEYLLQHDINDLEQQEKAWKIKFYDLNGYQQLFKIYHEIQKSQILSDLQQTIVQIILKILSKFIASGIQSVKILQTYNIFTSQLEFQEILIYLSNNSIPENLKDEGKVKQYQKLMVNQIKAEKLIWKGCNKQQIIFTLVRSMKKQLKKGTDAVDRDKKIETYLSLILIQILQSDIKLPNEIFQFLQNAPSSKLLKRIYLFIACLCFSTQNNQEIIERLISLLKNNNPNVIVDQYFKTLAVIIGKFGVPKEIQHIQSSLQNNIIFHSNQQIIKGSALLLTRLNVSTISHDFINQLWNICLFGKKVSCKLESTRDSLYNLLLEIAKANPQNSIKISNLCVQTLNSVVDKLKCYSENQLKNRSSYNFAGIKNLGAICYMIAMIQQLYSNTTFRYLILRIDDNIPVNYVDNNNRVFDDNLLHQFQKMFAFLTSTQRIDYNPIEFCFAFKDFSGQPTNVCIQQDSQEFTSMMFDRLQKSIKQTPFKHILQNIYGGKVSNLFTCSKCHNTNKRQQPFYSLSLQVKNYNHLSQSFNKLVHGELINDYKCDLCNQKADVIKKTVISKCPNTLILHLQRIVFDLDTYANQKISTKLQFPMQFDIKPYMLSELDNKEQNAEKFMYNLRGVVTHNGSAEFGHYYSYIRTQTGQWLQFNDSNIYPFDLKRLQAECFGGSTEVTQDEFDWTKKLNSKNAYMLIYEKKQKGKITLSFKNEQQKWKLLNQLNLKEIEKIVQPKQQEMKQDDEDEEILIRINSKEEFTIKQQQNKNNNKQQNEILVELSQRIEEYVPKQYTAQILEDNILHQYEINISSSNFIKFYSKILENSSHNRNILQLTEKLAFGIWLKKSELKELFNSLQKALEKNSLISISLLKNQNLKTLLLESANLEIRSSIVNILLKIIKSLITQNNLLLNSSSQIDIMVVDFLDSIFKLLPTNVSKNWLKFNQYFEFWDGFANQGSVQFYYLIKKQVVSHFLDYFLQKKSPLGIYANKKHVIGNKFTNPNFNALLRTVSTLIKQIMIIDRSLLSENDKKILENYDFFDKIITDNHYEFTKELILSLCKQNMVLSQKVAVVILKAIYKSNYQSIQSILNIVDIFLSIQDQFHQIRMKLILGTPKLALTKDKSIYCYTTFSVEQKLYTFQSTIQFDLSSSLLEPLYRHSNRTQNYCMLILKQIILLCLRDDKIFDYIASLPPPTLTYAKYIDFFEEFIKSYLQQATRYNYGSFPKIQVGNQVLTLLKQFNQKYELKRTEDPNKYKKTLLSIQANQQTLKLNVQLEQNSIQQEIYHPADFKYKEIFSQTINNISLHYHESQIIYIKTKPTGKKNEIFSTVMKRLSEKIPPSSWQSAKKSKLKGIFAINPTKQNYRIKYNDGCAFLRSYDWVYLECQKINQILKIQKQDWPKWSIYK